MQFYRPRLRHANGTIFRLSIYLLVLPSASIDYNTLYLCYIYIITHIHTNLNILEPFS